MTVNDSTISCYSFTDGQVTASAMGGAGSYTYSWSDINSQTNATATGLAVGTYTVTVTDIDGCNLTDTITLTQPLPLTTSTASTWPLCAGSCNGITTVLAGGGTPPYTYEWNDPNLQTTNVATGLCGGTYYVTVQDANGCMRSDSALLGSPNPLGVLTNPYETSCSGNCDGSIAAYPSGIGGAPPYIYLWNDPLAQTTDSATALCAGTYSVILTDSNGCTDTASATVLEPDILEIITSLLQDETCKGDSTGEIHLDSITGGTPPYTYMWNNGPTTRDIFNLTGGTYIVTVTDTNSCSITDTFIIDPGIELIAYAGPDDTICLGDSILIGGIQGVFPDTTHIGVWAWVGSGGVVGGGSGDSIRVKPDTTTTYMLVLSTIGPCNDTAYVTIFVDSMSVNVGPEDTVCNATQSYQLDSALVAGTVLDSLVWGTTGWGSFNYSTIMNPLYTISSGDSSAGSVKLYCTAYGGACSSTDTMKLCFAPVPASSFIVDSIPCFGHPDGILTINVDPTNGPYTYSWSNGDTTQTAFNLTADTSTTPTYYVTITNDFCTWTRDTLMPGDTTFNIHFKYPDSIYCWSDTTIIEPYSYFPGGTFSSPDGLTVNPVTGEITLDTAGEFHVVYSFEGPCQISNDLDTFHITVNDLPEINIIQPVSDTAHVCWNGDLGNIFELQATFPVNGMGDWDGTNVNDGPPGTAFLTLNPPGIYQPTFNFIDTVTQCENTDKVTIFVHPGPKLYWNKDSTICRGDYVPIFFDTSLPSLGPFEVTYENSSGETFTIIIDNKFDSILLEPSATTTYTLVAIQDIVTGCEGLNVSTQLTINVIDPPPPTIPNNILTYCKGDVIVPLVVINSDPAYSLAWFVDTIDIPSSGPVPGLPCDTGEATSTTWNPDISLPGVYPYSIYQFDDSLCCYSLPAIIMVEIIGETGCVYVYNAFSPNEDGTNDLWIIDGISTQPNKITIYNRWEDVVQEFEDYDNSTVVWDGTNKNGKPLPDGTYFYVIELDDETLTGWVQITNN